MCTEDNRRPQVCACDSAQSRFDFRDPPRCLADDGRHTRNRERFQKRSTFLFIVREISSSFSFSWVRQVCCPAASRISLVISSGWEISERWLAFTSMVLAPMRFAMKRSRSRIVDHSVWWRRIEARLRPPGRMRGLACEQSVLERLLDRVEDLRLRFREVAREIAQERGFGETPFIAVEDDPGRGRRRRKCLG